MQKKIFGGAFFTQHLLFKHLPYGVKGNIAVSSFVAVAVSYRVTTIRTNSCQQAWMAAEDKHTFLNPLSERTKEE
ncbi:hypothetical protein Anas_01240 [Armadillidium nasatum]|uniref:Uncharacterized protein n=1 Tax=Armadillidium nasatum TaxID=96803 RepID=A0A5N5T5R9_9CRUS|nr:hypothetical protein Anas_01240 [Armadillidium nasatum]